MVYCLGVGKTIKSYKTYNTLCHPNKPYVACFSGLEKIAVKLEAHLCVICRFIEKSAM